MDNRCNLHGEGNFLGCGDVFRRCAGDGVVQRLPIRIAGFLGGGLACVGRLDCCGKSRQHHLFASQNAVQCFQKSGIRRVRQLRLGERAEHGAHHAGCVHDDIHDLGGQGQLAGAQLVEQVFGAVAQLDQIVDVEESGAALDRVEAAENIV